MSERRCSIEGCDNLHRARGWCSKHYMRWSQHGSAEVNNRRVRQPCSVDGCDKPSTARTWCQKHYMRWQAHGDPLGVAQRPTAEDRLWASTEKTDKCWLWRGNATPAGYGLIYADGKTVYTHRLAWETMRGPIPKGLTIDHLCRVTRCVNPDHLEPVSAEENIRRASKARRAG